MVTKPLEIIEPTRLALFGIETDENIFCGARAAKKREKETRENLEKNRDCLGIFGRGDVEGPMKGQRHKYAFSKVKRPEPSIVDMLHASDTGADTSADTSAEMQNFADLFSD